MTKTIEHDHTKKKISCTIVLMFVSGFESYTILKEEFMIENSNFHCLLKNTEFIIKTRTTISMTDPDKGKEAFW